jgi:hypothetical protein
MLTTEGRKICYFFHKNVALSMIAPHYLNYVYSYLSRTLELKR